MKHCYFFTKNHLKIVCKENRRIHFHVCVSSQVQPDRFEHTSISQVSDYVLVLKYILARLSSPAQVWE